MMRHLERVDAQWFGDLAGYHSGAVRETLVAIRDADCTRALTRAGESRRRYLPFDWRRGDIDFPSIPSYGITSGLRVPPNYLSGLDLSRFEADGGRVPLGGLCDGVRDFWSGHALVSPPASALESLPELPSGRHRDGEGHHRPISPLYGAAPSVVEVAATPHTDCPESRRLQHLLAQAEAEGKSLRERGKRLLGEVAGIGALAPARQQVRDLLPRRVPSRVPDFPSADTGTAEVEVEGPGGAIRHVRAAAVETRAMIDESSSPRWRSCTGCPTVGIVESGCRAAEEELARHDGGTSALGAFFHNGRVTSRMPCWPRRFCRVIMPNFGGCPRQ